MDRFNSVPSTSASSFRRHFWCNMRLDAATYGFIYTYDHIHIYIYIYYIYIYIYMFSRIYISIYIYIFIFIYLFIYLFFILIFIFIFVCLLIYLFVYFKYYHVRLYPEDLLRLHSPVRRTLRPRIDGFRKLRPPMLRMKPEQLSGVSFEQC